MTQLYSFQGGEPQELPFRIVVDGNTRTDPSTFTQEELLNAGYVGPFEKPAFDPKTQVLVWVNGDYEVQNLAPQEIEARRMARIRANANYRGFWQAFVGSAVYEKLRIAAATDLGANMLVTELVAALGDAKIGAPNEQVIGNAMIELLGAVALEPAELDSLYFALSANGLYELFPIPGYEPPAAPEPDPTPEITPAPEVVIGSSVEPEPVISEDFVTSGAVFSSDAVISSEGEDTLVL